MSYNNDHNISVLKGRFITRVEGLEAGSGEVIFTCSDGTKWRMCHNQDCCETVQVEDVCGDVSDLIGLVLDARQETNSASHPKDYEVGPYQADSFTWTFYIIQTKTGAVTIRWLGESNGYYGEEVDFELVDGEL